MNWFSKLMAGRYGSDRLMIALLILSFAFTFIGEAADLPTLTYFGYVPLCFAVFRVFSRNTSKRYMENYKFTLLTNSATARIKGAWNRRRDKLHNYYKCPTCKAMLRVPKGKGKILITCRKCQAQFTKKT